ncbi:MAG: primosomal protein N' [Candidatus Omnitrophica bacterium CG22_combo_CG10-13_8_21_14_all_43_16]|nr:MAG: primosomal protein N' [Candidatus Omnitrophica bacterium CG22_combo_CG10-13_8_21_14_all_43_16]
MGNYKFADIVINRPIEGPFTYSIPGSLKDDVKAGSVVEVSFGNKVVIGYVVGLSDKCDIEKIKPISGLVDKKLCLTPDILELTKWISDYYYSSWGEAISAAVPGVLKKGISIKRHRKEKQEEGSPEFEFIDGSDTHLMPNREQQEALDSIMGSMDAKSHRVFLLHGVTGSGKTEVYLQSIAHALKLGLSSIILVPEISLTPQTVARFKSRFGDKIAVLHSRLLGSKRASEWHRINSGEARIVIGARSAIFAPVKNLGLVVVDEEHETSYKQEDAPRYNARDAAIKRAEISKAIVILGSATPSLESFYAAKNGRFTLIELSERIDSRLLPAVDIVDMREEMTRAKKVPIFSQKLREWIEKDISERKQVILFLNRRGFSTFINCRKCGYVIKCKRCSVSLTYHFDKKKLICHHCNFNMEPPQICPECNAAYLKYWGLGTEKVESELNRFFPQAAIARMDTDSTHKRGSHDKVLSRFKDGHIDIIIGTQMIAKGLDFPKVTLVGVISADTALNLPDFRSAERTFNLLTQVAGRAGRSNLGGRVIIQSYTPQHYSIQAAKTHDYNAFYDKEINLRKELNLPPFCHMVSLTLKGRREERVFNACDSLKADIEKADRSKNIKILGPAPSPISKIKGFYRWNIFLRAESVKDITCILKTVLGKNRIQGIIITVDVDPS